MLLGILSTTSQAATVCKNDPNKIIIEIPSSDGFNYNLVIEDKRKLTTKSFLPLNSPQSVGFLSYCSESGGVCLPASGSVVFTNLGASGNTLVGNISVTSVPGHPDASGLKSFVDELKVEDNLLCS